MTHDCLQLRPNGAIKDRSKLEGYLVAYGAGGGERGIDV